MKTYTVTSKQVSNIHNAMCSVRSMKDLMEETFKDDSRFVQDINYIFNLLEPIRKELMDKKDAEDDDIRDQAEVVRRVNGLKHSIWSIYGMDSFDSKSPVPVGSKIVSWYTRGDESVTVEGETWLDLWKAADKLIGQTIDDHGDHVFIEGFKKVRGDDSAYEVILGS